MLDSIIKYKICRRLITRKKRYLSLCSGNKIETKFILVGDRPGPSAPTDEDYHHTPFYSLKHCSGWLNHQLELYAISEENLLWINSANSKGCETDPKIIENIDAKIIVLGGNATKWLQRYNFQYYEVNHPQYWKRFKSAYKYPLLDVLAA